MRGLAFPKGRPAKLERADKRKQRAALDEAENKKVRVRSGGRCELVEPVYALITDVGERALRCDRRAVHIHHKIGGWGKRARGASVLAEHKLHVCAECHSDIHAHVLVPDGDHYRRVR